MNANLHILHPVLDLGFLAILRRVSFAVSSLFSILDAELQHCKADKLLQASYLNPSWITGDSSEEGCGGDGTACGFVLLTMQGNYISVRKWFWWGIGVGMEPTPPQAFGIPFSYVPYMYRTIICTVLRVVNLL
jgi:hypothetical protein